jgi:hypothetical protein
MVVLVARKARQVENDHELHVPLVQPAEGEQILKLAAVGRLGAFAFLVEPFEDVVALPPAVLLASAQLGRQAQVLRLLLRADANVDHRADHVWQRRSIRELGQATFARHCCYSERRQRS